MKTGGEWNVPIITRDSGVDHIPARNRDLAVDLLHDTNILLRHATRLNSNFSDRYQPQIDWYQPLIENITGKLLTMAY